MAFSLIRFNFVSPDPTDAQAMSDRYRAGLEIARYADSHGFNAVSLEEHHSSPMAWCPTPLLNSAPWPRIPWWGECPSTRPGPASI